MKLTTCLLIILCLASCQQSSKIPENFDYGRVENHVYKNDFFNFEVPVPDTWHIRTREQNAQMMKQGNEVISKDNSELGKKLKASQVNGAVLCCFFKFDPAFSQAEFNPSFTVMVENLAGSPAIKTSDQYLEHARSLMQQTSIYKSFEPVKEVTVGGRSFSLMVVHMHINDIDVNERYYATIHNRFVFSIIGSYIGEDQEKYLQHIVSTVRYNKNDD